MTKSKDEQEAPRIYDPGRALFELRQRVRELEAALRAATEEIERLRKKR